MTITMKLEDILDMKTLPWPEVMLPDYSEEESGEWRLEAFDVPLLRGYWRGLRPVPYTCYRLLKGNTMWMSTTPMELESQQHAIAEMRGHVVIAGAGMGITAYNAANHPEVETVTVIEIDREVIDFVVNQAHMNAWENWEKVSWIHADAKALQFEEGAWVDFLWADIWEALGSKKALGDTRKIQKGVGAKKVGWWGMEIDFVAYLSGKGRKPPPLEADWKDFGAWTGLPIMEAEKQAVLSSEAATNSYLA